MSTDMYREGEENVIAEIAMHTGNLLIVDDVAIRSLPPNTNCMSLHVNAALPMMVPIVATRQNGKRYILIPLDDSVPIQTEPVETVEVEKDEPNEPEAQ